MAPHPVIQVEELRKSYLVGDVTIHALRGVDLAIPAGAFTAVVGASGSGKSTFMNIIGLLDRPTGGRGADIVIEAVGHPDAFETATDVARRGGRIVVVGMYTSETVPMQLGVWWARSPRPTASRSALAFLSRSAAGGPPLL